MRSEGHDREVPRPGCAFDPVSSPWFFPALALAGLLAFRLIAPKLSEKPELLWLDLALDLRARAGLAEPLDPTVRFVEVGVNEEITRRFTGEGEYATAATVIETLAKLGVKVVAVDIIYTYGLPEEQRILAETIRRIHETTRTRVVLSASIEHHPPPPHLLISLPHAEGRSFDQGIVNVPADRHWREYRLVHRFGGETLPSLALAAYGASRPAALAPKEVGEGGMEWKVAGPRGGAETRRGDDSRLFLNLRHSYYDDEYDKTLPELAEGGRVFTIAEAEEMASRLDGSSPLLDTITFLGFDAELDGRPTTHGPRQPGMSLHATALHDLMHGTAIRPAAPAFNVALHFLVAFLAALAFSFVRSKALLLLGAGFGAVLILAFGWVSILGLFVLPASVSATVLWGSAVFLEVGRRWTFEKRERTRRDAMLGFYFSPAVLKQVTRDLDMIRPRGGEVAVLLSDLRGFTTLCETGEVEKVFELLNRLFAIETDAALREDGSLARFAGDQFLAYWGAPEPCGDAADRAMRAALEIVEKLKARRESPEADELDGWLRIGIGLHHGRGLVGHVGSRSYRDYNLVGDSVNTTARIESQTKNYAADILASGEFFAVLQSRPRSLLVDRVRVKGKAKATELHAVFGGSGGPDEEACRAYCAAFVLYEGGAFAAAATAFETLTRHPHLTIATSAGVLAERCGALAESLPEIWDGVFELTSK